MPYNTIRRSKAFDLYYWSLADYLVPLNYYLYYSVHFNEMLTAEEIGQEMGGN